MINYDRNRIKILSNLSRLNDRIDDLNCITN